MPMDDINFLHFSFVYFTYFILPKKTSTSFRISLCERHSVVSR